MNYYYQNNDFVTTKKSKKVSQDKTTETRCFRNKNICKNRLLILQFSGGSKNDATYRSGKLLFASVTS